MTITRDVAIWGATPQAIFAAIIIARAGKSVVIVSPDRQAGGMLTGGLGITDANPTKTWWGVVEEFTTALSLRTGYTVDRLRWCFAPSDAQAVFTVMIAAESNLTLRLEEQLLSVTDSQLNVLAGQAAANVRSRGSRIRSFTTDAETYVASVFLDASYGADLAAMAGLPRLVGREAASFADEIRAGVSLDHPAVKDWDVVDADGDLTKWGQFRPVGPTGVADRRSMGMGFRHCVTNVPANRRPWAAPAGYDPADFAEDIRLANAHSPGPLNIDFGFFFRRVAYDAAAAASHLPGHAGMTQSQRETAWLSFTTAADVAAVPAKFATNGSDIIGPLAWEYTLASEARRAEIRAHLHYREMGRFYTFANNPEVPLAVRNAWSAFGTCLDEWATVHGGSPGFPSEVYHREGRRIRGQATVSHWHCMYQTNWPDQIAVGGYFADSKGKTHFALPFGTSAREGTYGEGSFTSANGQEIGIESSVYFGIPMGAVVAPRGTADNLAVCWGISATAMAFSAIRLEPFLSSVACGVAHMALESLASGVDMARLSYAPVRARLEAAGAVLYRYTPPEG